MAVDVDPDTELIAVGLALAWHLARAGWWQWTDDATPPPQIPVTFQIWTCGACGKRNAPWSRNCMGCRRYLYFGKGKA